jgi:GNAT superfamily N-acetyltransferase
VVVAGGPYAGEAWPTAMLNPTVGHLDAIRALVISPEAQIEIKEMMPVWVPGRPRRGKDEIDICLLRSELRRRQRSGIEPPAIRLRPAVASDESFLRDMLCNAARWRPGQEDINRAQVLSDDHVARYVDAWKRTGDVGVVAHESRHPVGAAWLRKLTIDRPGYEFIDESIPELTIAVVSERRGLGIGARIMGSLLAAAREVGYDAISLSVEPDNPARHLYESFGFQRVGAAPGSWTMRLDLAA